MRANLTNAKLVDVVLDGADVRHAKGIVFDANEVDRLLIEGDAPDPWSRLRRAYTGPKFFFHLLLLTAFLLPYLGKAVVLTGISHGVDMIDEKLATVPPELQPLQDYWDGIDKQTALWTLLGFTNYKPMTIVFFGHTLMMIAYNGCRYYLTTKVGDLRESEERAKITPAKKEYLYLYRIHWYATWLMYVGYGALVLQIIRWLWITRIPTW